MIICDALISTWSMNILSSGIFPDRDHCGKPWPHLSWRAKKAGTRLTPPNHRAILAFYCNMARMIKCIYKSINVLIEVLSICHWHISAAIGLGLYIRSGYRLIGLPPRRCATTVLQRGRAVPCATQTAPTQQRGLPLLERTKTSWTLLKSNRL